jgi:hypothetical protein
VSRSEVILKIARDFGCLMTGIGGIVHQEYTGHPLPALLAVYTTLLGIPGAAALLALLRRPTTDGPSPSSAPAVSQSASPPLSTK